MTAEHFKPETMTLRWPIRSDQGKEVTQLILQSICHGDHAAALADKADERQAFARCARFSCGLTETEVKRLKMPDWNTLRLKISDLVSQDSEFFLQRAGIAINADCPQLMIPIQGDDGRKIDSIALTVPTVETTDLMQKQQNELDRNAFISRSCTGLSSSELNRLSAPDWNYLQKRVGNFLNESADYFRSGTSTS
ncbi:MAG: phage tail assembly protein [Gammaproteobacteria bacterium]|nr:phage tail assembly protein [Gammaproteobacteria bacterium]